MGIDPITHKPISSTDEHQKQEEHQQEEPDVVADEHGRSENISLQCLQGQEEEKSVASSFDFMETGALLRKSPDFCTDEVPMIQPHEIMLPCASTTSFSPTSRPSSGYSPGSSLKAEDTQLFPCMDWPETTYFCGMNDFGQWDLISMDGDGTLGLDPLNQHQRINWDRES